MILPLRHLPILTFKELLVQGISQLVMFPSPAEFFLSLTTAISLVPSVCSKSELISDHTTSTQNLDI